MSFIKFLSPGSWAFEKASKDHQDVTRSSRGNTTTWREDFQELPSENRCLKTQKKENGKDQELKSCKKRQIGLRHKTDTENNPRNKWGLGTRWRREAKQTRGDRRPTHDAMSENLVFRWKIIKLDPQFTPFPNGFGLQMPNGRNWQDCTREYILCIRLENTFFSY